MSSPSGFSYELVKSTELKRVYELETQGFPDDEAASLETIQYRHRVAPELFIGAYDSSAQLIGYINATCSTSDCLTHQSMSTHEPDGDYILIHSVCVEAAYRRQGLATALLKHYINDVKASCRALILVCHSELKPLYQGVGFEEIGKSNLVHGQRSWWEMRLKMNVGPVISQTPVTNPGDLICPVEQCSCIILKSGVGTLIDKDHNPLPMINMPLETGTSLGTKCWLVPNMLSFENISVTRPVGQQTGGSEMRVLACGACEFGPLGWIQTPNPLAQEFSKNPTGHFASVQLLIDCGRVAAARPST